MRLSGSMARRCRDGRAKARATGANRRAACPLIPQKTLFSLTYQAPAQTLPLRKNEFSLNQESNVTFSFPRGHLTAGALSLMAGVASAGAAGAATEWRGGGFLTDFTNCEASGWTGTQIIRARVRPSGLPGNHPDL